MADVRLSRRAHLQDIKRQFLFVCGAGKLTLRRIHWHRRTTVQPRSCMSPFLWQSTPTKKRKKKKKTTLVRGRTLKTHGGIQSNPNRETQEKLRGSGRVKLHVYSVAATLFSTGETLSGAFSFCGSPLVAHPCCLQTLLLHVQPDWSQRGGLIEDHQRFLLLDHWMVDLERVSLSFSLYLSLSPPLALPLSSPSPPLAILCPLRAADFMYWQHDWHTYRFCSYLNSTKHSNVMRVLIMSINHFFVKGKKCKCSNQAVGFKSF